MAHRNQWGRNDPEIAARLTTKNWPIVVSGLQTAIFVALVFNGVELYRAVDWSRGAMMASAIAASRAGDAASSSSDISDHFDSDGAVKCGTP